MRSRRGRCATALLLVALVVGGLGVAYRDELRTLASLRLVSDYSLLVMDYYGNAGLGEWPEAVQLRRPVRSADGVPDGQTWSCTCFAALGDGGTPLFGRNFDWRNQGALLLRTHPRDAYSSLSIVDIAYLGLSSSDSVRRGARLPSWRRRLALLDAPHWPFDGLNERGLAVGCMAVPDDRAPYDSGKPTLGSLGVMRLMLDRAATVSEAQALVGRYNIDFAGGPHLHYLLADASGDAAVIEFSDGEMRVIRRQDPWQVSTNFPLFGRGPTGGSSPCRRYNRAYAMLEHSRGRLSAEEAMSLLKDTAQANTMWSAVYDLSNLSVLVSVRRDYESHFSLEILDQYD